MSVVTLDSPIRRPRRTVPERRVRSFTDQGGSESQSGLKLYVQTDWHRLRQQFETAIERMNDVRLSIEARAKYLVELRRIRSELAELEGTQGLERFGS
jgi:hypothetical protein